MRSGCSASPAASLTNDATLPQHALTEPYALELGERAEDVLVAACSGRGRVHALRAHRPQVLRGWNARSSRVFVDSPPPQSTRPRRGAPTLRPVGRVAFEVGEVRGGAVRLEDVVVPAGIAAGLEPVLVLVNAQAFTKTANCWGVKNNHKGTNTNRIVLLRKAS